MSNEQGKTNENRVNDETTVKAVGGGANQRQWMITLGGIAGTLAYWRYLTKVFPADDDFGLGMVARAGLMGAPLMFYPFYSLGWHMAESSRVTRTKRSWVTPAIVGACFVANGAIVAKSGRQRFVVDGLFGRTQSRLPVAVPLFLACSSFAMGLGFGVNEML